MRGKRASREGHGCLLRRRRRRRRRPRCRCGCGGRAHGTVRLSTTREARGGRQSPADSIMHQRRLVKARRRATATVAAVVVIVIVIVGARTKAMAALRQALAGRRVERTTLTREVLVTMLMGDESLIEGGGREGGIGITMPITITATPMVSISMATPTMRIITATPMVTITSTAKCSYKQRLSAT